MPIVLTINDKILNPDHHWNDIVGVQYHYPNQYKNKVRPGEQFVYYRGVHRKISPRGRAEYFGCARIGQIRKDSATVDSSRPSWFCTIEDYEPFTPPSSCEARRHIIRTNTSEGLSLSFRAYQIW